MRILSLFILLLLSNPILSQQYLYIRKPGELPAERLELYDDVKVKVEGEEGWIAGRLMQISSTKIVIKTRRFWQRMNPSNTNYNTRTFLLEKVETIRVNDEILLMSGTTLITAVGFFGLITLVNGDIAMLRDSHLIIGSAIAGGGILMSLFSRSTYPSDVYEYFVIDTHSP